jgi:hypothetical protein
MLPDELCSTSKHVADIQRGSVRRAARLPALGTSVFGVMVF